MAAFAAMCMTVALLSVPTCRLFAGVIMAIMLPSTVTGLFLAMVVPVIVGVAAIRFAVTGMVVAFMLPSTVTGLFLAMVVPVIFSVIATRGFVAVVVAVMITFLGCRLAVRTSLQF